MGIIVNQLFKMDFRAEIGYITVSTVVILLDKVRELEKQQFIDPQKFRETEEPTSIDSLFVGCNVVLEGEDSAKSSMRKILFGELKKFKFSIIQKHY